MHIGAAFIVDLQKTHVMQCLEVPQLPSSVNSCVEVGTVAGHVTDIAPPGISSVVAAVFNRFITTTL